MWNWSEQMYANVSLFKQNVALYVGAHLTVIILPFVSDAV